MRRRPRRWILVGLIVLVLLAIGGIPRWQRTHQLALAATRLQQTPPSVIVVTPTPAAASGVMLPGSLIASEEVQVNARGAGYVQSYKVDIGAVVKAGQVLAWLQAPDVDAQYRQAVAQTMQSIAALRQAQAQAAGLQAQVGQAMSQTDASTQTWLQAQATAASYQAKIVEAARALRQAYANRKYDQSQLALDQKEWIRYRWLADNGFATREQSDQQRATYYSQQAKVEADSEAIQTAAATVDDAQASARAAEAAVRSAAATVRAAQQNVSSAQASLLSGQDNVRANRAAVEANRYNQKRYQVEAGFEKVVAPFDGIITARNVDVGSLVSVPTTIVSDTDPTATAPKTGLFAMARLNPMLIQVDVPQTMAETVAVGAPADVLVREIPGRQFPGRVTAVAGGLDAVSRTLQVKVSVSNPAGRLRPGQYADVHLMDLHPASTLQVPATAMMFDAQGTRLAIVGSDDRIRLQPVTVGRDFGSTIEILTGLRPGQRVVETPDSSLQNGTRVRPVTREEGRKS